MQKNSSKIESESFSDIQFYVKMFDKERTSYTNFSLMRLANLQSQLLTARDQLGKAKYNKKKLEEKKEEVPIELTENIQTLEVGITLSF